MEIIDCGSHEAWVQRRRQGIGGSDAAAVCGLDDYHSHLDVWEEKVKGVTKKESWQMRRGKLAEPIIDMLLREQTGYDLVDIGPNRILTCADPKAFYSPDRIVEGKTGGRGRGLAEFKAPGSYTVSAWEKEAPLFAQIQLQHGLYVSGFEWGIIAALDWDKGVMFQEVERHPQFIEMMLERENAFWHYVESMTPPPPIDDDEKAQFFRLQHPSDDGSTVELPEPSREWDSQLVEAKDQLKRWKKVEEDLKMQFKEAIGSATYGRLPTGQRYSLRLIEKAGYAVGPQSYRELRRLK